MKNMAATLLNDEQKARIRQAIADLERTTSGEVVAALVDRCRAYYRVELLSGLLVLAAYAIVVGVSVTASAVLSERTWAAWVDQLGNWTLWAIGAPVVFVLGALLGKLRSVASRLVPAAERQHAAGERAETLFVQHRLFRTEGGTGMLLAGFLFERTALVYGDAAVNDVLKPEDWQGAVDILVEGLRTGQAEAITQAYVDALGRLTALLAEKFPKPPGNPDELPNEFIIE